MYKKSNFIKILIVISLSTILLMSLYFPIGLHSKYLEKNMITPYPFTEFYFRSLTGILILSVVNIILIYTYIKIKSIIYSILTISFSLLFSYLIGQQLRITEHSLYESWNIFPIRCVQVKNLDLLRVKQSEEYSELKSENGKYPNAKNLSDDLNWLYFQYGEKDSCIKIFNMYPEFIKLKKQQIKK